ncbi:MAG TPA: glycosyltransferase family 39 protein [Solirubrobacteraceae bacterium]|nr:glycosyltransferase family 39 protein [Solirubrobacteraceae bacterium]
MRRRFPVPRDLASLRRAALSPAGVAVVLALLYLILNLWWVSVDQRVPNGDSGKHLNTSLGYLERFEDGQRIAWFWLWTEYPPLVHLVGMLGAALSSGDRIIGALFAQNLIFFPLLALGLYGTGKIVAGRWAGVLALVFGLAAPMVMSLFHVFMLDAPATALVAMSVWLMLLSERFTRRVPTLLAGVAVAAGFYVKPTFVLFIAGFVLVILLRGAWRNRLNLVLFAGTVFVIAAPWYLYHRDKLASQTEGAANAQQVMWYGNVPYPDRWSLDNFTWYGWNLVNNQLYLPLTLFFVVGAACAVWWVARRRAEAGVLPELLAGCVAGWFLVSLISLDDPRYSLPLLVYIAVLATWWIVRIPPRTAGLALAAVLVFFAGLNTIKQNFDYGVPFKEISFEPTDGNPIRAGQLTLWATRGYIEGSPDETGPRDEIVDLLRRAQEDGAEQVVFDPASLNNGGFNLFALAVMGRAGGLEVPGFDPAILEPNDIFVFRAQPRDLKGRPAFCLPSPLGDGTGFFMYKGVPTKASKPYCPPK